MGLWIWLYNSICKFTGPIMGFLFVPYGVSYGTLKYHFIEILFWLYISIYKFTGPIIGFVSVPYGVSYGTLNYHFIELLFWLYNSIYKFTGPIMGFVFVPYGVSYGSSKYPFFMYPLWDFWQTLMMLLKRDQGKQHLPPMAGTGKLKTIYHQGCSVLQHVGWTDRPGIAYRHLWIPQSWPTSWQAE